MEDDRTGSDACERTDLDVAEDLRTRADYRAVPDLGMAIVRLLTGPAKGDVLK